MYRILESEGEVRERRDQLVHPAYTKPELLATGPNQLWSWDITKLLGPAKWTYFYLYVILDVFSRYVVGWMVADGESSELAKRLIADSCGKQKIEPGKLTDWAFSLRLSCIMLWRRKPLSGGAPFSMPPAALIPNASTRAGNPPDLALLCPISSPQ
jgi:transposase InsO family protein